MWYRYVFWDQHEPVEGVYNFENNNDLVGFIKLAQQIGFVVILRVGPYVKRIWIVDDDTCIYFSFF